jgi:hypothetical protein
MLASPQAVEHDADLLFGRMVFAGDPADVLYEPLRRRFSVHGFLSHLHSSMVTMSQKSSAPQAIKSVSQALMTNIAVARSTKIPTFAPEPFGRRM